MSDSRQTVSKPTTILVKDLIGLINFAEREVSKYRMKLVLDGGGGFSKVKCHRRYYSSFTNLTL